LSPKGSFGFSVDLIREACDSPIGHAPHAEFDAPQIQRWFVVHRETVSHDVMHSMTYLSYPVIPALTSSFPRRREPSQVGRIKERRRRRSGNRLSVMIR
jgi:hypothetical protein